MISETCLFKSVSECTSSCSSRLGTHTGFLQVDDEWQALCSTLLFFFDFSILLFTKLFYKRRSYQCLSVYLSTYLYQYSIPSSIPVSLLALRKQVLWGDVCSGGSSRDGRRAAIGRRRVGGDFCFPRALWGGRHWHGKDLAGANKCEKLRGFQIQKPFNCRSLLHIKHEQTWSNISIITLSLLCITLYPIHSETRWMKAMKAMKASDSLSDLSDLSGSSVEATVAIVALQVHGAHGAHGAHGVHGATGVPGFQRGNWMGDGKRWPSEVAEWWPNWPGGHISVSISTYDYMTLMTPWISNEVANDFVQRHFKGEDIGRHST